MQFKITFDNLIDMSICLEEVASEFYKAEQKGKAVTLSQQIIKFLENPELLGINEFLIVPVKFEK